HRDAEEAHVAELAPEVLGELVRAIDLGGQRRDLLLGELVHGAPQHLGGLADVEVEHGEGGDAHDTFLFLTLTSGWVFREGEAPPAAPSSSRQRCSTSFMAARVSSMSRSFSRRACRWRLMASQRRRSWRGL